jgi:hypothetical protein
LTAGQKIPKGHQPLLSILIADRRLYFLTTGVGAVGAHMHMRFSTLCAVTGLAAAAFIYSAWKLDKPAMAADSIQQSGSPPPLSEFPKAKAGRWRMTSTVALNGAPKAGPSIEICIDQTLRSSFVEHAAARIPSNCQPLSFHREQDGVIKSSTVCAGADGTTQSYKVAISGDFVSKVVIDGDGVMTGGPEPASTTEVRNVLSFTWAGRCLKGQKGGDMTMLKTGGGSRSSPPAQPVPDAPHNAP